MRSIIDNLDKVKKCIRFEKWSLILLGIILISFGNNHYLDIIYTGIFALILLIDFKEDRYLFLYFTFYVYQEVLTVPIINISFLRIYQLIYIIRLIYKLIRKEFIIERNWKVNAIFIIFFLSILMYQDNFSVIFSLLIFQLPLLYELAMVLKNKDKRNQFLIFIVYLALCSAAWGVLVGGENSLNVNEGIIRRGSTFTNPNLSALIYLLGLVALLGIQFQNKLKYVRYIFFILLTILLLSTSSITGILLFALIMFVYTFLYHRRLCLSLIVLIVVSLILLYNINSSSSLILSLQNRINRILYAIQTGDMAILTSNRSYLTQTYLNYFFEMPLPNILFGGYNTTGGYFSEWFQSSFGVLNSHNFIIDLLYGNGIFGCFAMIGGFIYTFKRHCANYIVHKDISDFTMMALKFAVIGFALSTYIYPSIVFYIFFFI